MPTYNFKRNTQIYIVYAGLKYKLLVYPDVTFSQTFAEESYQVKTLHAQQDNFEGASITKANPANFNLSVPILKEADMNIVFNLLVGFDNTYSNVNQFDLYAVTTNDTFTISGCIMETGKFTISRDEVFGLSVTGTGTRLQRVGDSSYSIPGTLQEPSITQNYIPNRSNKVTIDGSVMDQVVDIYLELRNNITWTQNDTLQYSLLTTDQSNTIYPENFTVTSRLLNGAITRYSQSTSQRWSTNSPIEISTDRLLVSIPSAVSTNRLDTTDIYTEVFDFRMLSNPTSLSSVITLKEIT